MFIFTKFSFAVIFCLWASNVRVFNIPDPTRNGITPSRNQCRDYSKRNNESLFVPQGVLQYFKSMVSSSNQWCHLQINGVIFKSMVSSSNQWCHLQIAADKEQHTENFEKLEFVCYQKWALSQLPA